MDLRTDMWRSQDGMRLHLCSLRPESMMGTLLLFLKICIVFGELQTSRSQFMQLHELVGRHYQGVLGGCYGNPLRLLKCSQLGSTRHATFKHYIL